MSERIDDGITLERARLEDLLEELRSRRVDPMLLSRNLGIPIFVRTKKVLAYPLGSRSSMRFMALTILGLLSLGFLILISYLAVAQRDVPDLISGLAGSCIGAIAGILTGDHGTPEISAATEMRASADETHDE